MADVTLRITKGSALSLLESDTNIYNLNTELTQPRKPFSALWRTPVGDAVTEYLKNAHALWTAEPIPRRIVAYVAASTIYIDPTYGTNGVGSFADPKNTWSGITFAANTAYLQKRGTSYTGSITVTLTNTVTTPTIFGVYDEVSGLQLRNNVGAATINANSASQYGISIGAGSDYIGIHGLKVTAVTTGKAGIYSLNGSSHIQVLFADVSGLVGVGIWVNTGTNQATGWQFEGVKADGCGDSGILLDGTVNINDITVQFCNLVNNIKSGIYFGPYNGTTKCITGLIACNNLSGNYLSGVRWLGASDDLKIIRNTARLNGAGAVTGNGITIGTTSGGYYYNRLLIQNNDCHENEFGIYLAAVKGSWLIEGNRCWKNGSRDGGTTAATASKYGRGIELYSTSAAASTECGVVRFNSCCEQYCFIANFTEGRGIGLDNYTANVDVYGNYCARNDGCGLDFNTNANVRVFCNLLVDNAKLSAANASTRGITAQNYQKAEMWLYQYSMNTQIFNNTLACGTGPHQKYGIADQSGTANRRTSIQNNLIINAAYAGIVRDTTATTESYNGFQNCAAPVIDAATLLPITTGTGNVTTSTALVTAPYYVPAYGGLIDAVGTIVDVSAMSLAGTLLGSSPPIGAVPAR